MHETQTLVDSAFRSDDVVARFAPIAGLMHQLQPQFRLPLLLEMMEHPPAPLLLHHIAHLNLVYSPPKVGSTTISETLRRLPLLHQRTKLRHIHFLSERGTAFLDRRLEGYRDHPDTQPWLQQLAQCHWLRVLLAANRVVRSGDAWDSVKKPIVITGVREPVGQYLSLVFELRWMYAGAHEPLTADAIHAGFAADPWLRQLNDWFADDLGSVFDTDVYATPFPTERGWHIYENDVARILLIRQESLAALASALAALYRVDPATIDVIRANEGGNKTYAEEYRTVRREFQLSARELNEVYAMPYVRHFYTPEEIAEFKRHWGSAPGERVPLRAHAPISTPAAPALPAPGFSVATLCRSLAHRIFG